MNKIEAIGLTRTLIAETQANCECTGAAEVTNLGMRNWVANIILAELQLAMKGIVLFRKATNGNPEVISEDACKKFAAKLHRRAKELSTKKPASTSSDEAVCIFYFFPQIIGALERIARVFDPTLKIADAGDGAEDDEEATDEPEQP